MDRWKWWWKWQLLSDSQPIKSSYYNTLCRSLDFPGGSVVKNPPANACRRCKFRPWVGKLLWRKKWQPTLVFLVGKSHGQRSLVSYSPWGFKESDSAEHIAHGMARNGDGSIWIISMDNCGCWPRMRLAASLWMWSRQGLVHQGTNCC